MLRLGIRISRSTIYSFCLVTASFWTIFLFLNFIDRVSVRRMSLQKIAGNSQTAESSGSNIIPGFRHWKRASVADPKTTFSSSPYNAANKRKLTGKAHSQSGPKLISWQASRTLRVLTSTSDMFKNCPISSCEVSPNSNSLKKADAIVFDDGRTAKQTPPQLSGRRVLVYYNMRTPKEIYFKAKGDLFAQYWKSAINWIWSFRLNSDIFEPFAYLRKTPILGKKLDAFAPIVRKKSRVALWIDPKVNIRKDSLDDLDKNYHKGTSQTGIKDYLKEFKKEVPFDTVSILDFKAKLDDPSAKEITIMSKYYFILAFEWVDCRDYITDLFFYAFDPRIHAVPVVRGGFNYTLHFPKDIFVNAGDFQSPQELAKYLDNLASNTKAYTRMLWLKSQYVREAGVSHAWCQLCDMLHRVEDDRKLMERYEDFQSSLNEGACRVSNTSEKAEI